MDENTRFQRSALRFSEELVLLLLDKDTGLLSPVPERSLWCALAGAVLMDLALENRIDTDLDTLLLVDPNPVGDDLLDPYLKRISQSADSRDTAYWIDCLAKPAYADQIYQDTLGCLIKRGIVEREGEGMLSVANRVVRSRRYPHLDGEAGREVELRIMSALFSEEIPSPRDVMLIALVDACGIFERLLSPGEMVEVRDRLKLIGKMDLIARTVFAAIRKAGVPDARSVPGIQSNIASKAARTRALAAIPLADGGGLPIAGNAFRMMGRNLIYYLARQYRELGPVFRLRAFQRKLTVLAGPEANQFLQRKGRLHLRSHDLFAGTAHALGAHRIISSVDGAEHLRFRKVFRNGYSRKYFLDRMDDAVGVVARELDTLPRRTPMPALPILRRMIGKQIGQLCIGFQADEYLEGLVEYLGRIVDVLSVDRPKFMLRTPRMRRLYVRLETLCQHIVELHENAPPPKKSAGRGGSD